MWGLVPFKLAWLVPAHRSPISFVDFLGPLPVEQGLLEAAIELEDSCISRLRFLLVIEYRFGSEIFAERWQFCSLSTAGWVFGLALS